MRRATRAASSCSTFNRPGLTFTRMGNPSTSTVLNDRVDGHRSRVAPRTPSHTTHRHGTHDHADHPAGHGHDHDGPDTA